jgi:nucleotide-binding universal stress UspA family protein
MDHNRLKGRSPFPFETLAVAVAFSPRLDALLAEARRLASIFNARLLLIHVGQNTPDKEESLKRKCTRAGISHDTEILWRDGDPVSVLLETCKENIIDLLLLGALQRESMFRYYLGSVARGLSRRAKCSLLMLTEPKIDGSSFQNIVVSCTENPKTLPTLNTAVYFAGGVGCREIQVVKEVDQVGLAMALSDDSTSSDRDRVKEQLSRDAEETIQRKISAYNTEEITLHSNVLFGRPGFVIRQYAEGCKADLLVINSPDSSYGLMDRIFTHDMEYILEDLPCNILIVHSRTANIT